MQVHVRERLHHERVAVVGHGEGGILRGLFPPQAADRAVLEEHPAMLENLQPAERRGVN